MNVPDAPIRQMLRVLDREHEVLKAGHLSLLAEIADEKSALEVALRQSQPSPEDLEILRAKAACNADLLAAAIRGVKAARQRLSALSDVREVLSVYGPEGDLRRVKTGRQNIESKA